MTAPRPLPGPREADAIAGALDVLVTPGAGTRITDLGAAWIEAESELPEGAFIGDLTRYWYDSDCGTSSMKDTWTVTAFRLVAEPMRGEDNNRTVAFASGPTPAAALLALAAKLREAS